jgi:hypothetical protein
MPVRIRSARCFGVYASADADGDTIAASESMTRWPHSRQNFADGGSSVRQFEQVTTRRGYPCTRKKEALLVCLADAPPTEYPCATAPTGAVKEGGSPCTGHERPTWAGRPSPLPRS